MHAQRMAKLSDAMASCVGGPALALTDVSRRLVGTALLCHEVKRADRLLGNQRLRQEARSICAAPPTQSNAF
jgi:hypothetical protein